MASQIRYSLRWNDDGEAVFNAVKKVLGEIANVKIPNFTFAFYVNPSFGPDAIGAIIL